MKYDVEYKELDEDEFNALCELLTEVDDIQIYWFVQDCKTIIVEGALFDKHGIPLLTVADIQNKAGKR